MGERLQYFSSFTNNFKCIDKFEDDCHIGSVLEKVKFITDLKELGGLLNYSS